MASAGTLRVWAEVVFGDVEHVCRVGAVGGFVPKQSWKMRGRERAAIICQTNQIPTPCKKSHGAAFRERGSAVLGEALGWELVLLGAMGVLCMSCVAQLVGGSVTVLWTANKTDFQNALTFETNKYFSYGAGRKLTPPPPSDRTSHS